MRALLLRIFVFIFIIFTQNSFANENVPKDWTIFVYLNGDDSVLDKPSNSDFSELQKLGSTEKVNVIVYRDFYDRKLSSKIYKMSGGQAELLKDYAINMDSGDFRTLEETAKFAFQNFPAKKNSLIIWGHGAGWKNPGTSTTASISNKTKVSKTKSAVTKGVSWDGYSGNFITTQDLGVATRDIASVLPNQKIDLLAFDTCLMQMQEVMIELSGSIKIMVGSSAETPADGGFAYDKILERLHLLEAKGEASSEDLSKIIVEENAKSFSAGGSAHIDRTVYSAVDVDKVNLAKKSFNDFLFYAGGKWSTYKSEYFYAIKRAMTYAYGGLPPEYFDYVDIIDFIDSLSSLIGNRDSKFQDLAKKAKDELAASVIETTNSASDYYGKAKGISIWLPDGDLFNKLSASYKTLAFAKDTYWDEFLKIVLLGKTNTTSQSQSQR